MQRFCKPKVGSSILSTGTISFNGLGLILPPPMPLLPNEGNSRGNGGGVSLAYCCRRRMREWRSYFGKATGLALNLPASSRPSRWPSTPVRRYAPQLSRRAWMHGFCIHSNRRASSRPPRPPRRSSPHTEGRAWMLKCSSVHQKLCSPHTLKFTVTASARLEGAVGRLSTPAHSSPPAVRGGRG